MTKPFVSTDNAGLRRVIANGKAGAELWPHDPPVDKDTGLVRYQSDAIVSVVSTIPDTHQR